MNPYVPPYVKDYQQSRDYNELRNMMFSLVIALRAETIVETGLSRGLSTRIFLEAAKYMRTALNHGHFKPRVYTIDISDYPETQQKLLDLGLTGNWTFIKGDSVEVAKYWKNSGLPGIDLLYLDSDHSEEHVIKELEAFEPYLNHRCIVLVDDTLEDSGPLKAIAKQEDFEVVRFPDAEGMCLLWR